MHLWPEKLLDLSPFIFAAYNTKKSIKIFLKIREMTANMTAYLFYNFIAASK